MLVDGILLWLLSPTTLLILVAAAVVVVVVVSCLPSIVLGNAYPELLDPFWSAGHAPGKKGSWAISFNWQQNSYRNNSRYRNCHS
jgi:hypothetical protein